MLNEVVSYIEQCLRSHLNPRCKPVFVSFRPSRPPPQFYLLVSVSPTDVFLSPPFFPPFFPSYFPSLSHILSPLSPRSRSLCSSTWLLSYRRTSSPLRRSPPPPFAPPCIAASRLRSVCYTEGNIALQLRSSLGTIIRCYVS